MRWSLPRVPCFVGWDYFEQPRPIPSLHAQWGRGEWLVISFAKKLIHICGPSLHLLSVDYVHGRISPEQVVPLATQSSNLVIRGQDRVLVYIPVHPLAPVTGKTMVAIHLDYPGTTLEILLPLAQDGGLPVVCPLAHIHSYPQLTSAKV